MFYRVKPGHERQIREEIEAFFANPIRTRLDDPRVFNAIAQTGVHDIRLVLFDGDTRLVWLTSFDTEWDPYIDDTFAVQNNFVAYGKILQHTVEAPEGIADPDSSLQASSRPVKDLFVGSRVVATGFAPTFPDATTWDIKRGERLVSAFQKVLDNRDAEEALSHPALRPLLDEASQ